MLNQKELKTKMSALVEIEKYISGLVPNSTEESKWKMKAHQLERELQYECVLQKIDFAWLKKEMTPK